MGEKYKNRVDVPREEGRAIRQYRESHHRIAEMVAMGCTPSKIRRELGVSQRRLTLLTGDPAFQELIAVKARGITEEADEQVPRFRQYFYQNMVAAEVALADDLERHFDEDDDFRISTAQLSRLSMERADRAGFGKTSTLDVRHNIGDALDQAIARTRAVLDAKPEPKLIEGTVVTPPPPQTSPPSPRVVETAQPRPPTRTRFSFPEGVRARKIA